MRHHVHGERHRLSDGRVRNGALQVPRDAAARQVKQQVHDPRGPAGLAEQAVQKRGDLGPDPGQRRCRGEERIEERGTQGHGTGWNMEPGLGTG